MRASAWTGSFTDECEELHRLSRENQRELSNNRLIGLAEYGLDPNGSSASGTAAAVTASTSYLAAPACDDARGDGDWGDSAGSGGIANWAIDDKSAAVSAAAS